jgi:hypothetical protein
MESQMKALPASSFIQDLKFPWGKDKYKGLLEDDVMKSCIFYPYKAV